MGLYPSTMAATERTSTAIEAFFRPSTRSRDSVHLLRDDYPCRFPEDYTELELLPGLSLEDALLSGSTTWEDFCRFLRGKVLWVTPDVYLTSPFIEKHPIYLHSGFYIGTTNKNERSLSFSPLSATYTMTSVYVHVVGRAGLAAKASTCECLVRMLGTSDQREVLIGYGWRFFNLDVTGPTLARLFEQSRDNLRRVTLENIDLTEDQIRALATVSASDLKISLRHCGLASGAGCHAAFIECLQSDRGPTELLSCNIDRRILAEAITGNTRVVSLKLAPAREDDVGMNAFVRALPNSRGLVDLDMSCNAISDEHWRVLCESLMVHPAISTLVICETPPNRRRSRNTMSDAQKACRTRAIADMLQENTILHTIRLSIDEFDSGSYAESIQPGLETNLYRPRVLSIEEIDDSLFRRKVLGRALSLHSVRSKPNLIWMFLSQNVDIACVGGNG
jgi:hypothetical protein